MICSHDVLLRVPPMFPAPTSPPKLPCAKHPGGGWREVAVAGLETHEHTRGDF